MNIWQIFNHARYTGIYPLRQRTGIYRQIRPRVAQPTRGRETVHRTEKSLGEWVYRILQREATLRAVERKNLRRTPGNEGHHRTLALRLQHHQPAQLTWIQTASTRSIQSSSAISARKEKSNSNIGTTNGSGLVKQCFDGV